MRARSRGAAMLCRLLALMAVAVTLASAQLSNLFGEGHETYTIAPNDCLRVRLGGTEADRASFAVSSRPALDVSGRVRFSLQWHLHTQYCVKIASVRVSIPLRVFARIAPSAFRAHARALCVSFLLP